MRSRTSADCVHCQKLHTLVAFESALRSPDRLEHCDDDAVWIQLLSLWLSQLITPGADLATEDQIPDSESFP